MINTKVNVGFKNIVLGAIFLISFGAHGKNMFSDQEIKHAQGCAELSIHFFRHAFNLSNFDQKPITEQILMSWAIQAVVIYQQCLEKQPVWKDAISGKQHLAYQNASRTMQSLLVNIDNCRKKELKKKSTGKEDMCPAMVMMNMLAQSNAQELKSQLAQRLQECDGIKDVEEAIWR